MHRPQAEGDHFRRDGYRTTAVVIAGAGARGAYESGVLAEVLPPLFPEGLDNVVLLGTSAGALNAALWAARATRGADLRKVGDEVCKVWHDADQSRVFAPVVPSLLLSVLQRLRFFSSDAGIRALLDTAPLRKYAAEVLDAAQLARNVAEGSVGGVGVVATSCPLDGTSGRSRVFFDGKLAKEPAPDPESSIDYVRTDLEHAHVVASAAIPVVFPAIFVPNPEAQRGYYVDGGVRLNTPIEPALKFSAGRIIVVSSNATTYPPPAPLPSQRPDVVDDFAQLLHAVLADGMIEDLRTLRRINGMVRQAKAAGIALTKKRNRLPFVDVDVLEISPEPGKLAKLAQDLLAHTNLLKDRKRLEFMFLRWALAGVGGGAGNSELLSYLLFDPRFAQQQIELGRSDGKAAVDRVLARELKASEETPSARA